MPSLSYVWRILSCSMNSACRSMQLVEGLMLTFRQLTTVHCLHAAGFRLLTLTCGIAG
jgi:hypothetical protein